MIEPYVPIACALHDEYEIAIMHKKQLSIKWFDTKGKAHSATVQATDILVSDKEEFLVAKTTDNKELTIRLDRVSLLDNS